MVIEKRFLILKLKLAPSFLSSAKCFACGNFQLIPSIFFQCKDLLLPNFVIIYAIYANRHIIRREETHFIKLLLKLSNSVITFLFHFPAITSIIKLKLVKYNLCMNQLAFDINSTARFEGCNL